MPWPHSETRKMKALKEKAWVIREAVVFQCKCFQEKGTEHEWVHVLVKGQMLSLGDY